MTKGQPSDKPTCGQLYLAALADTIETGNLVQERIFAAGFIHGQCEKVYIGAARAAMFRLSDTNRDNVEMIRELAAQSATIYKLICVERAGELWVCRDKHAVAALQMLDAYEVNSRAWHQCRGQLCGIPPGEWDVNYHKRREFNRPCDGTAITAQAAENLDETFK